MRTDPQGSPSVFSSPVDTKFQTIDRASSSGSSSRRYRLNQPIAVHGRAGAHHRRGIDTERRGMNGATTPHQKRELDDLRAFEAMRKRDRERAELGETFRETPDLRRCVGADTLIALRDAGKFGPYNRVPKRVFDELQLDKHERAYLRVILAAQLGLRDVDWIIARHADMSTSRARERDAWDNGRTYREGLLDCCETYAARAARSLVARQLLVRVALYDVIAFTTEAGRRVVRHARGPCAYRVPERALALLGIPGPWMQKYQASDTCTVNPDQGTSGARELSAPVGIDAPALQENSTSTSPSSLPVASTDATPTTPGPHADESSSCAEHSASALEPVAPSEEAPEGSCLDGAPTASTTRRLATLERTFAKRLDALADRQAARVEAISREAARLVEQERAACEEEKQRYRDAVAKYAATSRYGRNEASPRTAATLPLDPTERAAYWNAELAAAKAGPLVDWQRIERALDELARLRVTGGAS